MPEHKMQIVDGVRYRSEDAPESPPEEQPSEPDQQQGSRARRTRSSTRGRGESGDHSSE